MSTLRTRSPAQHLRLPLAGLLGLLLLFSVLGLAVPPPSFGATAAALSKIVVSPSGAALGTGETQTFTAQGYTQGGVPVPITPSWSVSGGVGTITSAGVFTATAVGHGSVVAKVGTVAGSAKVSVFTRALGNISGAVTWTTAGSPYVVYSTLIDAGATLTIEPGVVVKFESTAGNGLNVNGTLNALGTSGARITFTSLKDDSVGGDTNGDGSATAPKAGDWNSIEVTGGGTANLDYATLAYGGTGALYGWGWGSYGPATLKVNHSLFKANLLGLDADSVTGLALQNTSFTGNTKGCASIENPPAGVVLSGNSFGTRIYNGIALSGTLGGNLTLPGEGVYTATGVSDLTVPAGVTLTLRPGVIMKSNSDIYYALQVKGTLNALGTSGARITFTSLKDDSVGGDTNGDGSATAPKAGDWNSIEVTGGGTANLDYATLAYGGTGALYGWGWGSYGPATLKVNHSLFKANLLGLDADSVTGLALQNTSFTGNTKGCASIENPPAGVVLSGNSFGTRIYNGIALSGMLGGNLTLPGEGVYTATGVSDLTVPAGVTLTLRPGVIMKFGSLVYDALRVEGKVDAEGTDTPAGRIHFTSLKDDSVGGDTNGDGSATAPKAGDWNSIAVHSGASVTLRYAVVTYGGSGFFTSPYFQSGGAVDCESGVLDANGCDFYHDLGAVTATAVSPGDPILAKATDCYWGNPNGPSYPGNANGPAGPNAISYHYVGSELYLDVNVADYRVGPLTDREKALAAITAFSASPTPGLWTSFTKASLVADMRDRVDNPVDVSQGGTPLCGPAAIVYELVLRDPVTYVRDVQQCYEQGQFQGTSGWITNTNSRLYSEGFAISPTDWILMAVMRNAQNGVFSYDSGDDFSAITTWDDMKEWSEQILGFGDTSWNQATTIPFIFGPPWSYETPWDDISTADANYRAGGVSFLLVNADMVRDPGRTPFWSPPNHWVVYQGDLTSLGAGGESLAFYSWGRIYHCAYGDPVAFDAFLWGVVRGDNVTSVNGN